MRFFRLLLNDKRRPCSGICAVLPTGQTDSCQYSRSPHVARAINLGHLAALACRVAGPRNPFDDSDGSVSVGHLDMGYLRVVERRGWWHGQQSVR